MLPRLTPRRSRRRSKVTVAGLENEGLPFLSTKSIVDVETEPMPEDDSRKIPGSSSLSLRPSPASNNRPVLTDKASSANAPLSPCPSVLQLDPVKSPKASDVLSDASSDFSPLTPPVRGPPPLMVSAKRLGQDVRRRHSKRRRCRSRRGANSNANGFCLWQDADATPSSSFDSSDENDSDAQEVFPFLNTQIELSPSEQTKHYWEWCYGKGTSVELKSVSWSSKRAPPTKGCLSNKKVRRKPSPNASFKTPTQSPEEYEEVAKRKDSKKCFRVQFGSPKAVEYEVDEPAGELTPLPSEVTRERYSMDQKEKTGDEVEMTQETKQNTAVLAEWEDEFDEPRSSSRHRRKSRRASSLFTPSPMILDKEGDNNSMTPPKERQETRSAASPSAAVTADMASLTMKSPSNNACPNPSQDLEPSSLFLESPSPGNCETKELSISLTNLNSTGAAMDLTPPLRSDQSDSFHRSVDTTPPPANVSLDTIHSVGGALDHESPALKFSQPRSSRLSPISRMSNGGESDERFEEGSFGAANRAEPLNIVRTLLKTPSSDQQFDSFDVFMNLSKAMGENPIEHLLDSLNIDEDGLVACTDDLLEKAKYCANTKSKTKFKIKDPLLAWSLAVQEWQLLELEFLGEISLLFTRKLEMTQSVIKKASSLKLLACDAEARPKSRIKILERQVAQLDENVCRQRNRLSLILASEAPYSALFCQASSHLGIYGFRLDEYTGDNLYLSYEHVVEGVESCFVFDVNLGTLAQVWVRDAVVTSQSLVPKDNIAARFHGYFLQALVDGKDPFLKQLLSHDLQEAILLLSRFLGRLDLAAIDVLTATESCATDLTMPIAKFSSNNGLTVVVCYDRVRHYQELLLPSVVRIEKPGKPELRLLNLPVGIEPLNCIQKLIEYYS